MPDIPACSRCGLENTYPDGDHFVCADCGHEWPISADAKAKDAVVVRDVNGNILNEGDTVTVIKDLKPDMREAFPGRVSTPLGKSGVALPPCP